MLSQIRDAPDGGTETQSRVYFAVATVG